MSKSKARKKREHAVRNNKRDAALSRGTVTGFSTHVRKSKTKKDTLHRMDSKHKKKPGHQQGNVDDRDFLWCLSPPGFCRNRRSIPFKKIK
ncbi:hypothetical protein JSY36_05035 [Bacillus sp. H-16]|uniref:hypothetical protein n=1 Tax=Alteribacter salitolerans TaxID=2912333 RepID=UPI0019632E3D|nr:hypothetical protein [Alteribacter salitolerans]MBM7095117.1 hypothetical protein [Alteribacter salitolerans]